MTSELVEMNRKYLKKSGWREIESGRWLPKGVRLNRKRPGLSPFYSLTAAIQTQMKWELEASGAQVLRNGREGVVIVT